MINEPFPKIYFDFLDVFMLIVTDENVLMEVFWKCKIVFVKILSFVGFANSL